MTAASQPAPAERNRALARRTLLAFTLTFSLARILVFLIMSRRIPDLYLHLGGTHVHHLNYGIFLLSWAGAYLLFAPLPHRHLPMAATVYGIGLALTFDEFGMWLHLGGSYWQRGSFDAIIVLASLLALAAYAPPLATWRPRQVRGAAIVAVTTVVFYLLLAESFRFANEVAPRFQRLEQQAPQ